MVDVVSLVIEDLISRLFLQIRLPLLLQLVQTGPFLLAFGFSLEFLLGFLLEFLPSGVLVARRDERLLLGSGTFGDLSPRLRFSSALSAFLALTAGTPCLSYLTLFLAIPNHLLNPLIFLRGRGPSFLATLLFCRGKRSSNQVPSALTACVQLPSGHTGYSCKRVCGRFG